MDAAEQNQAEDLYDELRKLSAPDGPLNFLAPTATVNNPKWFIRLGSEPDEEYILQAERLPLHRRLVRKKLESYILSPSNYQAINLSGPPGAGKSRQVRKLLGDKFGDYINIDPDEFKVDLLQQALDDGSYDSFIKPESIRKLENSGHRVFPLDLASLVHEESSILAQALRIEALDIGKNVIIDLVLSNYQSAIDLAEGLQLKGYTIWVIDVETTSEISSARVKSRWLEARRRAIESDDALGGRWVPSEYIRFVFRDDGKSVPKTNARAVYNQFHATKRYQLYWTDTAESDPELVEEQNKETGES